MWIWCLLLSIALIGSSEAALAAESGGLRRSVEAPGVPTTITSNRMTVRNQDSQAVFDGMVVLTRGSLVVHSDKMVVSFQPKHSDGESAVRKRAEQSEPAQSSSITQTGHPGSTMSSRSVNRVEAIGAAHPVKIKYANGNATCQKAVYFSDGEKVVLTGDPVAWEKGTRVSGRQITIYLAEERSVVEGGSHIHIEGEGQNGQ
ncbi:MAG TPA: LptA/OstA family protein [Nitrospira sp.]|nr:LptA/OstA family protein [Nitrospira sp.]